MKRVKQLAAGLLMVIIASWMIVGGYVIGIGSGWSMLHGGCGKARPAAGRGPRPAARGSII
ncbi:MAG: hypothetical protein WA624_21010 [Methylocella sp.]